MKRPVALFAIVAVTLVIVVSGTFIIRPANAESDYSIEYVIHTVGIMYNGYVSVNDTIELNVTNGRAPMDFFIGFPDRYAPYLIRCLAHSGSDAFNVTTDVSLENRIGFYGARVDFPSGAPQVFTVGFVFSNHLLAPDAYNATHFALDFPAYPSLTKKAGVCNASIALPQDAVYLSGDVGGFVYAQENLPEFTHKPTTMIFGLPSAKPLVVDITELRREIGITEFGEVRVTDTYKVMNKALQSVTSFEVFVPSNASEPSAEDQLGRLMETKPELTDAATNRYDITLGVEIKSGRSSTFTVKYLLLGSDLKQTGNDFTLDLSLFEYEDYYINQTLIIVTLPEGARLKEFGSNLTDVVYGVGKGTYQDTVTFSRKGVVPGDYVNMKVTYEYNPLWSSFRPTMWVWTLAIVGCAFVAVSWRKSKGAARIPTSDTVEKLGPERLKSLVDAYEEKMRIVAEMNSLEARVQKGRIPRRRYKVRMRTLEARASVLSKNLSEFMEKARDAGGRYLDLMRQLEVAETEINEAGANLKSIEGRHNRGEISLEAYRKLLADYQRRKQNAENTISGILLRLREEIG